MPFRPPDYHSPCRRSERMPALSPSPPRSSHDRKMVRRFPATSSLSFDVSQTTKTYAQPTAGRRTRRCSSLTTGDVSLGWNMPIIYYRYSTCTTRHRPKKIAALLRCTAEEGRPPSKPSKHQFEILITTSYGSEPTKPSAPSSSLIGIFVAGLDRAGRGLWNFAG